MTHDFQCHEQPMLVDLLYDECDPEERRRLELHVAICGTCAADLRELRAVRSDLQAWTPPQPALGFQIVRDRVRVEQRGARAARFVPAWAMAAAAALVLAAGAAIANLEVRFAGDGLTVRTGWNGPSAPSPTPAAIRRASTSTAPTSPWRADLATLERQLRREFSSLPSAPAPVMARSADRPSAERDAELLRRVRALIEESEGRQQRELALRLTDVARDFEATRRADLVRIERGLNSLEQQTGVEVGRQREILNYFMRASTAGNRQ